ncbi:MAG TPA: ferritin-like domain-containing protein [Natronosporangium sp.]
MTEPTGEEFAEALAAEHAAIFAYGVIGGHLDGGQADAARDAEAAHRSRRDALLLRLAERGEPAPVAAASYELPFPVTGADSARRLATLVEERVGAVWRAALPATTGEERAEALAALVDAAIRATGWRRAAGVEPATVAFPGEPE